MHPITTTLRDGTPVLLRPVTPADRERLKKGFELLSQQSRYLRFFSSAEELTDEQLRYFTEVDQVNHVAWGALNPHDPDFPGYGIARFVRLEEDPDTAEAAVTVLDAYQGRGLGTLLIALLVVLARRVGVKTLRGTILPANRHFVAWLHNLGAKTHYQDGALRVEMAVDQNPDNLPQTPSVTRFLNAVQELQQALG